MDERQRDPISGRRIGSYEVIDGSYQRGRFDLYFTGTTLTGEWLLEKAGDDSHRSWHLAPVA